jgi:hypothetical protein
MRYSQSARNVAKKLFAVATIGLAAACADGNVAPKETAAFKAPASFTIVDGVQTFTVSNSEGAVQRLGQHVIVFPAGSICDPRLSSYGPTEWDKPCLPLQGSITITATMLRDNENHPYVDFQPALRFAPTKNVMLFLRNGRSSYPTQLSMMVCNALLLCYDESMNDPSLKPFRVGQTSMIGRRVKHFTGYMISVGDRCEGSITQEPDGSWMCNTEGMERRSGYMVASGKTAEQGKDKSKDSDQQ